MKIALLFLTIFAFLSPALAEAQSRPQTMKELLAATSKGKAAFSMCIASNSGTDVIKRCWKNGKEGGEIMLNPMVTVYYKDGTAHANLRGTVEKFTWQDKDGFIYLKSANYDIKSKLVKGFYMEHISEDGSPIAPDGMHPPEIYQLLKKYK